MREGDVRIVPTGQAGSIVATSGDTVWVLLRSGELWVGPAVQVRESQSPEDLAAAPVTVERVEPKRKRSK